MGGASVFGGSAAPKESFARHAARPVWLPRLPVV
jgi:hypothetical protein